MSNAAPSQPSALQAKLARSILPTEPVMAAIPEATASAPTPPSSAATRCSSTSLVGFMIRV